MKELKEIRECSLCGRFNQKELLDMTRRLLDKEEKKLKWQASYLSLFLLIVLHSMYLYWNLVKLGW